MDSDPFEQVVLDTKDQIEKLSVFLHSNSQGIDSEVNEVFQDIEETITDLEKSVLVMRRNGNDTSIRDNEVDSLKNAYARLKSEISNHNTSDNNVVWQELALDQEQLDQESALDSYENPFQEQMLREQDDQLDSIHHTMTNLHLQARTMGEELQDQGELIEDMDSNMNSIGSKLSRGRRHLEWIYERNKEKYNDCCIIVLIAVLIILLVLAFIA